MKVIIFSINVFITVIFWSLNAKAQEAIVVTCVYEVGKGGSVSYSIGQSIYTTSMNQNGSIVQGVQQVYQSPNTKPPPFINNSIPDITFYPNPTTDFVNIILKKVPDFYINSILTFSIIDLNGKILLSKESNLAEVTLEITDFASSTYFLRISSGNQVLKILEVIKK